ncbi:MAG: cobalamin B12-binding domain-containing protein [Candidatus Tectomicrobia bacterium]|uniref:Cobalamin B12-binding domain-containing protein n=1 Tax=Tectimicrobiota bacterium TaxID=2528274 RepID=A0A933GLU7_UNCTE|nr:cobalamin B12-binding domain-containing protein [Candidatus Tectomicrobia bacterium]
MKILLINPPREHMIKWTVNDWELDLGEISSFPPIGLMYLASYLRATTHHEVEVLDAIADKMDYESLRQRLRVFNPDVVGITSFTFTFYDVLQTAKMAKEVNPSVHVCLGGPHTSLFPDETLSHPEIDSLVVGDGEIAFKEWLDCLEQKIDARDINGVVVYREGERIVKTDKPRYIADLDALPFPGFDLLDSKKYYATFGRSAFMATICSSRGCPFQCTYCQVPDKKYRMRSPENVLREMLSCYDKGIRDFYFFDDMFNINAQRVIDLSEQILKSEMSGHITWLFRGRVDGINEAMLKVAREAGCRQILLGVEDYTDVGLEKIKKRITMKQAFEAVKMARKYGIETSTNWIIGFPHHNSAKDIYDLIDTAIRINSDYAQFSILQLFPGCEMYEECVREGSLTAGRWSEFVRNPVGDFYIELYTKHLTALELSNLYREAHVRYYKRPSYILRRILKLRSFAEFKVKARAALAVLR